MSAASSLLGSLIDYAGLFPPAQLAMPDAVRAHAAHLAGPHRAALGRFVVPLVRLAEFDAAFALLPPAEQQGWQLSVLAGPDPLADVPSILVFNSRHAGARIVSVETKISAPAASTAPADIARLVAPFPSSLEVWIEIPPTAPDLSALLDVVRATGRGAKLRTGGTTPDAFPPPADVARFLRECHRAGVAMKATAGLHHPLRGDYRLTYAPGSATGKMFGFLNVFLAAALVHTGGSDADALALLDDGDASHFTATPDALAWRSHRFTAAQIDATRAALCRSFGSCSFTEPLDGLQELRWI
ncbi:MAG: hypothetical protein HYV96_10470 [Opitutae bacterium]|nr:hypothetical protein [Opitutae bacterium]